jgi:isopentenyldiphosphate isomerase
MPQILNVVDDDDKIIGKETRENIHQKGLLHREVHVFFVTPQKEFIFERRSKQREIYPGLLDACVGCHVGMGDSYKKAAFNETKEKTGLPINVADLIFVDKKEIKSQPLVTGMTNNAFKSRYLFVYDDGASNLKSGSEDGFEVWPIDKLISMGDAESKRFVPYLDKPAIKSLYDFMLAKKII